MGAFDDLIPGAKPKAQDFGAFTDLVPPEQGDFTRGAKVAFGQLAPIAKGVVGLVGATAEKAFGEGGLATGTKNWGLRGFTEGMQRLEPLQRETDDVTVAWQRAKDGDLGALLDWAQYGLGYAVGQAGEAVGAALLGAGAGIALAPEVAPVSGAAGAVTGLVAKGAVRQTAVGLIERAVAKEANRLMAEGGGRMAAQDAVTIATKSITREIGASGALLTLGMGQELGSIYPEAEAEAIKRGEQLDGADLARVWASGLAAGGVEGLTDRLGIQAAMGRVRVPGAQSRLGQAGLMGVGGAALEGATEAVQTGIERFGAQKDILSPEGVNEIINASALGAIGGGAIGGAIGAVQGPAQQRARSNEAFQAIGAAKSADEAIAAFEQTYEEITVPPQFDADGAMNRLEAQRQRDEQALRQFGAQPDAPRGTGEPGALPAQPSAPQLGDAEPFADRLLSLRDLIADSRNRQQVRDTLGPVALNDLMYYLSAADNAKLPGQTSDRMLQVAEAILNRAQIRREERPGVGVATRPALEDTSSPVPQIPLDTAPTGRIRVDADGVAVQEIGADVVSTADTMRAEQEQGFRFAGPGNLSEAVFPAAQQKLLPGPQPAPTQAETAETVDNGAHEAAASPTNDKTATKEQILGGNAELGHTTLPGLDISVENPAGSERVDLKNDPPKWRNTMKDHYGYIRGSTSIDGEHMDVFMREGTATSWQGTVFVVDQIDPKTGKPDEHKVMLGYDSVDEAKQAYRRNYSDDWKGMKAITAMPYQEFRRWVFSPQLTKKPLVGSMTERAMALKDADRLPENDDLRAELARVALALAARPVASKNEQALLNAIAKELRQDTVDSELASVREQLDRWERTLAERERPIEAEAPAPKLPAPPSSTDQATVKQSNPERWNSAELEQRQQWMRDIGRADLADHKSLGKWDWLKLSAGSRAALMKLFNRGEQPQQPKEKPDDGRPATPANRPGDEGARQRPRQEKPQEAAAPGDQARQEEKPVAPAGEAAATPTPETAATEGAQDGLQEEGRRQQEEVAAPSAGATPADPFTRYDGITLERKVSIAGTGEVATIRFDAGKALRDLAAREQAVTRLRACVLRGGS